METKSIRCIIIIISSLFLISCNIYIRNKKPKGFYYFHTGEKCNLCDILNIHGYYISEKFQSKRATIQGDRIKLLILYEDGIVGYVSGMENDILDIIKNKPPYTKDHLKWGTYLVQHDTLKIQYITLDRNFKDDIYVIEADYLIKSSTELELIKEENVTYPQYTYLLEGIHFLFYPCENKIDSTSWLLNKKWFWDEDAYKKRRDK